MPGPMRMPRSMCVPMRTSSSMPMTLPSGFMPGPIRMPSPVGMFISMSQPP